MQQGHIADTNEQWAEFAFDYLGADAVTANPYFGQKALEPFLRRKDKGVFVLCKTSNVDSGEFQDLIIKKPTMPTDSLLYQYVAKQFSRIWSGSVNCGLVVGATYPEELAKVRSIIGDDITILSPGFGTQDANLKEAVLAGRNSEGRNFIPSASRSIILSPDPRDMATTFHVNVANALKGLV